MWGWHKLPDNIDCFKVNKESNEVSVPLGIAWFIDIPRDLTIIHADIPQFINVKPYDYQVEAVKSLTKKPYWMLHATTGSGKTIMAMMIAQSYNVRTLIVVKDKTLLKQFITDIQEKLWVNPNYYGWTMDKDYKKSINTDVIAVTTIQSAEKVDLSQFSLVILDEVHTMLGSDKRREWVGSIKAPYMYGLTGTPIINDMDNRVFNIYVWPTTKCDVVNMTPDYCQVFTGFEYDLDDIKDFHLLKASLYGDYDRNSMIVNTILDTIWQGKWVVFTEHVEHAKYLKEKLESHGIETHLMIGQVHQDERKRITQYVKDAKWPQLIIGSVQVVGTGFDLSELSRAYLTTSTRFKWDLLQFLWRIIRKHPTKQHPVFYDFCDINCPILYSQSTSRARAYKQAFQNWKISTYF